MRSYDRTLCSELLVVHTALQQLTAIVVIIRWEYTRIAGSLLALLLKMGSMNACGYPLV